MELISMSDYNTTKDVEKRMVVLNKTDHASSRTLKKNATTFMESIVSLIFYALQRAKHQGVETDHSLSVTNIRTLDIKQVQSLIHIHCKVSHSRDDIVDALQELKQPNAVDTVETLFTSEIDGKTFDGIRLHYTGTPVDVNNLTNRNGFEDIKSELLAQRKTALTENLETDDLALELSQMTFIESADTSSKWETDAKAWKNKALKLYEQQTIDRDTIQSLRAVIIDMAETLHVADPIARIGMTSSDLLDLIHSKNDMSDNAF